MTQEERLIVSAYTGVLMTDFDKLQAFIEEVLGRPVFTHELASETVQKEIADKLKPRFLALCGNDNNETQSKTPFMEKETLTYITCPHCGEKVLMDWTCSSCKRAISYDIKDGFIRTNPHKPKDK